MGVLEQEATDIVVLPFRGGASYFNAFWDNANETDPPLFRQGVVQPFFYTKRRGEVRILVGFDLVAESLKPIEQEVSKVHKIKNKFAHWWDRSASKTLVFTENGNLSEGYEKGSYKFALMSLDRFSSIHPDIVIPDPQTTIAELFSSGTASANKRRVRTSIPEVSKAELIMDTNDPFKTLEVLLTAFHRSVTGKGNVIQIQVKAVPGKQLRDPIPLCIVGGKEGLARFSLLEEAVSVFDGVNPPEPKSFNNLSAIDVSPVILVEAFNHVTTNIGAIAVVMSEQQRLAVLTTNASISNMLEKRGMLFKLSQR